MRFKNQANCHIEEKTAPWLWSLIFGGFYLIASGLWAPFFIWAVITVFLYASMGPPATILVFIMNAIYAGLAPSMVRASYLRKGWVEIFDEINDGAARAPIEQTPIAPGMVKCPFCAEEIKVEAIKCKHCGSDIKEPAAA